jgi:leucyl aminopeptidase
LDITTAGPETDLSDATLIVATLTDLAPLPEGDEGLAEVGEGLLELARFEGKPGQVITVPHPEAAAMVIVGLGEEASFEAIRAGIGNAVRAVKSERAVTTLGQIPVDGAVRAVVEGAALGGYEFRDYKTNGEGLSIRELVVIGAPEGEIAEALIGAESTNMARDWVNTPALDLAPDDFAAQIAAEAERAGLAVETWDLARIQEEGLGALLGVAAGSDRDPALVILAHEPESPVAHLGLVGKGITFDSGGLSIKQANFMEDMKDDMSGAATVAAATIAIARLEMPVRVTAVLPLTDNAIGGKATRPGDVLRPVQGPTIEVLNTDAEGRLILADGLGIVARYAPDVVIDVATLTGAARVALGDRIGAVFSNDPEVASRVLQAASRAGEHFWELPLFKEYRKAIDSDIADMKNVSGSRYGGAIVAAVFLAEYAGERPWAHLDIAGPARARETIGEQVRGGSGVAVRTLIEVARAMAEPT